MKGMGMVLVFVAVAGGMMWPAWNQMMLTSDSINYLSTAENIARHRSLRNFSGYVERIHPFLYPVAVAAVMLIGLTALQAAFVVNWLALAVVGMMAWVMLRAMSEECGANPDAMQNAKCKMQSAKCGADFTTKTQRHKEGWERQVGEVAGAVAVMCVPPLTTFAYAALSETLFSAEVLVTIWVFYRLATYERGTRRRRFTAVQWHYLERKIWMMVPMIEPGAFGVDLGCGRGEYTERLARKIDGRMLGVDLDEVREDTDCVVFHRGDMRRLPVAAGSVDFVCAINSIHHLETRAAQRDAVGEAARVLKGGGLFFLHEMNARGNPLLRAWLKYVFVWYSEYDDGSELWVRPNGEELMPECMEFVRCERFTFIPDLTPRVLLPWLRRVEARLEHGRLRRFGAHYMSVWRKA